MNNEFNPCLQIVTVSISTANAIIFTISKIND